MANERLSSRFMPLELKVIIGSLPSADRLQRLGFKAEECKLRSTITGRLRPPSYHLDLEGLQVFLRYFNAFGYVVTISAGWGLDDPTRLATRLANGPLERLVNKNFNYRRYIEANTDEPFVTFRAVYEKLLQEFKEDL